jgi:hypothetical protein
MLRARSLSWKQRHQVPFVPEPCQPLAPRSCSVTPINNAHMVQRRSDTFSPQETVASRHVDNYDVRSKERSIYHDSCSLGCEVLISGGHLPGQISTKSLIDWAIDTIHRGRAAFRGPPWSWLDFSGRLLCNHLSEMSSYAFDATKRSLLEQVPSWLRRHSSWFATSCRCHSTLCIEYAEWLSGSRYR